MRRSKFNNSYFCMKCPFHVKDKVNSRPSTQNILSVDKSRRRGVADIPEGHRAWGGAGGCVKLSNRPAGSGHVNLRNKKEQSHMGSLGSK